MYEWKSETWYLIDVSYNKNNPVHRALFFTGFLNEDGMPGSYNMIISHSYQNHFGYSDIYYLKVIREIVSSGEIRGSFELPKGPQK